MIYNDDTLTLRILNAGLYSHKDGAFEVSPRSYAALSYRSRGTAIFKIGAETITINPGDIIFIPSGVSYGVNYFNSESLVIHLDFCSYTEVDKIVLNNKSEISTLFHKAVKEWTSGASQNIMKSLVFTLLSAIEEDASRKASGTELSLYTDYIEKSYKDPTLTVERICSDNYVSHSTLQRMFLRHLSVSPKEYVIRLRLKCAVELLLSGKANCREAAYLSGFSDEKYFSRVFKKHYSVPPSKFLGERE